MADVFDQIHAQQPAAAGGDVFDQIHSSSGDQPLPAFKQPDGSPLGRFLGGLWNTTAGGVLGTLKSAASLAYQAASHPGGMIDPNSAGGQAIASLVQSHVDQAQKAKASLDKGNYVEAFGHTLATAIPLVGPAAAHAGERMGGSAPKYDKYGNVVTPGQAPDIAGGLGEGAGLVASAMAPTAVKAVRRKLPASIQTPPVVESTLNPVEQSAVDYLNDKNVPITAGTRTGNPFVRAAEKVTEHSPLGAQRAADFNAGTEAGLTRVAGELSNKAYPSPVSPESAGVATKAALGKNIDQLGLKADAAYEKAWQGRNNPQFTYNMPVKTVRQTLPTGEIVEQPTVTKPVNMPVDVRDIKASLKPIYAEMQWMPAADRASSAGYQAVKNIIEGDDFIPAWQAEKGLSGIKSMARVTTQSGVRDTSQGVAASIIPTLQEGIDAAVAHTGDHAIRGLQAGRAAHASKMEVADLADQLRGEPVQAFNQLTWQKDAGIAFLRKIAGQAPDVPQQIGRAYIDQLFDEATREGGFAKARTILSRWQQLGPETKKLFFPNPALRAGLDNFFKGGEMVGHNVNPSGTALTESATSVNPLRWAAGYAGSKLLYSPQGVKILTEGLKIPMGGSRGAIAENALKQFLKSYGTPAAADLQQRQQQ